MKKLSFVFLSLFFGVAIFLISPIKAFALDATVSGKAKVANTLAYLDFNASPYSSNVKINNTTGNFSGYAWLEDIGWAVFGTEEGNTAGPVNLNMNTGAVTGKALVLNTGAYLDFTGYNSNVLADIAEGIFLGQVWSEDIGWIDFTNTGVSFTGLGYTIGGAPADITVVLSGTSTDVSTMPVSGLQSVDFINTATSDKIADLAIDFTSNVSLANVSIGVASSAAFFHSAIPISTLTNGASTSYTLYVPKGEGNKVWICPGAATLNEVSLHCASGYYLSEGQTANGATASVEGAYWKITGLTGTGGMSVITGLSDSLSRLKLATPSDHTITFGTNGGLIVGSTDTMVLEFPDFDLTGLTVTDIELTDNVGVVRTLGAVSGVNTWGVIIDSGAKTITFSVPTSGSGGYVGATQIVIKIGLNATGGANQIINPSSTGSFKEIIILNNTAPGEMGEVDIPIVDSDSVDVTGYVTAYLNFDIDTNSDDTDCAYNVCKVHGGVGAATGENYTVDLGELTSAIVNKSLISSKHADGLNGLINSIYFDITTNAPSGAVVVLKSLNGGLQGPGTNKIPSIGIETGADGITRNDGEDIPANSGVYGYNLPIASTVTHGTIIPNSLCDSDIKFCGASNLTPKTVFTTNNLPVDTARVRMDLAAAANYTNNPGVYTDTLTFTATATF